MIGCGDVCLCCCEHSVVNLPSQVCVHISIAPNICAFCLFFALFPFPCEDPLTLDDGVPYPNKKVQKPEEGEGHVEVEQTEN